MNWKGCYGEMRLYERGDYETTVGCMRVENWFCMRMVKGLALRLETEIFVRLQKREYDLRWIGDGCYWDYDFRLLWDYDGTRYEVKRRVLNGSVMGLRIWMKAVMKRFETVVTVVIEMWIVFKLDWSGKRMRLNTKSRLKRVCYETTHPAGNWLETVVTRLRETRMKHNAWKDR
jgi:hypothetical protein